MAAKNSIAGSPPTTVTDSCPTPIYSENPQIQVTVTRTGLPSFFAKMWSSATNSVSATATAEVYNPSYDAINTPPSTRPAIAIHGVKPLLVFNGPSGNPAYIAPDYSIVNGGSFIGTQIHLSLLYYTTPPTTPDQFYALDGPAPVSCPSTTLAPYFGCNQIGTGPTGANYIDNIACENGFNFSNGQQVGPGNAFTVDQRNISTASTGYLGMRTIFGISCLTHAGSSPPAVGQDIFTTGIPVTITGGSLNPDTSLRGITGIHRSDSVVAVPVFNCPSAGPCDGTGAAPLQIVGFLQLGIQDVTPTAVVDAVILNAAGLDPTITTSPVMGQGTSPVPVRLICIPNVAGC